MSEENKKAFEGVPAYNNDHYGYGVAANGTLLLSEPGDDGKHRSRWISDGYARISEEVRRENGDAIFFIEGMGSKDGHTFKFQMKAEDFADSRKLKGKLTAQFGASNRVGGLTGDIIQQISLDIKKFKLIETPRWLDDKAAVPGLDLVSDLKYSIASRIPVDVSGGNSADAQVCLKNLLSSWDPKLTTIAYAAILGAPIVEKWFSGDRFCLVLKAITGSGKTEFIKTAMATYGSGYLNEDNLVRWGEGSTKNALMKFAASAGFLPLLVDNYKPVKKDDPANLIGLIHAVIEGSDKARLSSDSEFKESLKFACTLLITGEDFPEESSTMARCVIMDWSQMYSTEMLSVAQGLAGNLPAIGREWLTWLSNNKDVVDGVIANFETRRSDLFKDLTVLGCVNAGRLSATLTLLQLIWEVALKCPILANVLQEFIEDFNKGITSLQQSSPAGINAANEAEDFVATLNELIGSGKAKLVSENTNTSQLRYVVGWVSSNNEVCIFPTIAIKMVSDVSQRSQNLTSKMLYKQLDQRGYLKTDIKDGCVNRTLNRKFNGKQTRVLVFTSGFSTKCNEANNV